MNAIADTGFVVAVANRRDRNHSICRRIHDEQTSLMALPQSILAESAYLMTTEGGNIFTGRFLMGLSQSIFRLLPLEPVDIQRTAELLMEYADSRLDFVDATVVTIAERLNITRVLTLDQRDFRMMRPRHCEYFEILP
ncbi:MAG TPA: PIN domain-containing protein [Aggregatilineales bacterium]|nr:PIN domain-containing protein [Aggregatilineales bacterium]